MGSPAHRRKHETLVADRTPPLRPLICTNQTGNARGMPMHPPRSPSRLLGCWRRMQLDRLALTLPTRMIQIRGTVQDGVVLIAFVRQIRRLGRVARKLVHSDGTSGLEIVLLILGSTTVTTRGTEFVRHEEVKEGSSETGTADDVDEVMVCEVHGAPVEHGNVRPHVPCRALPEVGDE